MGKVVHVCIMSEQLVPNVLPILLERPETVVLLATRQMEEKCALFVRFLKARGVKTEIQSIPAYDFQEVVDTCRRVISDHSESVITLNVTGGTKVAALAAYQQFYFDSLRIIYVDTSHNRILELGDEPRNIEIGENLLKVRDYLACYGKQFTPGATRGAPPTEEKSRRAATVELCNLFIKNPQLLLDVNRQVAQFKQTRTRPYFGLFPNNLCDGGDRLCRILLEAGVATAGIEGSVNINSDQNLFYLGGGWLEEYVYGVVADLGIPGLDLCMNVEIEWFSSSKEATHNELDIAFSHRNRLHIISCKTSGLDINGSDSQKGKEALYELDSLADNVGGLFARSMLVSAHRLGKVSCRRAKDLRIDVVSGMDVLGLKKRLKNGWLR